MANKGDLPDWMPAPIKLADHNHQIRSLGKAAYALANAAAKKSRLTTEYAARFKRGFSFFLHGMKHEDEEVFFQKRYAPICHLFNIHDQCTVQCPARRVEEAGVQYVSTRPYLNRKMHSNIWGALTEIIDNYCKIERIKEVLHSKHSNTNEALNHAAMSRAPKGIHYASSSSLESRVHTMIAIHNMGHQQFVNTILTSLGSRVGCYLHEWAVKRDRDKDSKREREREKGRKFARKMRTDKEWARKVKENQLEKQGTIGYKSGIGLDTEAMLSKLDNNKVSNTMASKKICRSGCGLTGHYDRRDLFCPLNPINQKNKQQFNSDATNEEMRQDSIEATTNQAGTYQGPNFEAAADNVVGPSAEIEEDSLTGCVDDWCSESGGEEMIFFGNRTSWRRRSDN